MKRRRPSSGSTCSRAWCSPPLRWPGAGVLGALALAGAPAVAGFYREPRLVGVTAALAAGFVFNALGIQHGVMLQREMRFTMLAVINTVSLVVGSAIGIGGALAGFGYW